MSKPIILELTPELFSNLRLLVVAGAKSPQTGEDAIMGGAQLLQLMGLAYQEANKPKANGHDDAGMQPGASVQ